MIKDQVNKIGSVIVFISIALFFIEYTWNSKRNVNKLIITEESYLEESIISNLKKANIIRIRFHEMETSEDLINYKSKISYQLNDNERSELLSNLIIKRIIKPIYSTSHPFICNCICGRFRGWVIECYENDNIIAIINTLNFKEMYVSANCLRRKLILNDCEEEVSTISIEAADNFQRYVSKLLNAHLITQEVDNLKWY